jgi:LmbE family N-acetylglucosaminyl deacetylase
MQKLDLHALPGTIVIVAPHMDDEVLACGGLIARLPGKERLHIIYATDGMRSPAPIMAGDRISTDLGKIRMQESVKAMKQLGVPEQNLHFLCLPEAELMNHISRLGELLKEKVQALRTDIVFVPFRYDRHPDHLAVNHVVVSAIERGVFQARLIEYFVYYRWRLMPRRDIRKYVKSHLLYELNIEEVAGAKRQSLDCFRSQTTIYYPWQTRPILTSKLLDEECRNPEYFLLSTAPFSGTGVFSGSVGWIRLVHRLEPILLRWKYQLGAFLKRMIRIRGH